MKGEHAVSLSLLRKLVNIKVISNKLTFVCFSVCFYRLYFGKSVRLPEKLKR